MFVKKISIDYFVRDMVDAWTDFIDDDKLMQYLDDNQNFWRRIESRNIKSLQDTIDVKDEESRQCKFIDKKPV